MTRDGRETLLVLQRLDQVHVARGGGPRRPLGLKVLVLGDAPVERIHLQ